MTELQVQLLRSLISNKDIKIEDDKKVLSHEASKKVADYYRISIGENDYYSLDDTIAFIASGGKSIPQPVHSEPLMASVDEVVEFLATSTDENPYTIVQNLEEHFPGKKLSDFISSAKRAGEMGAIANSSEIVDALYKTANIRSITAQINKKYAQLEDNPKRVIGDLSVKDDKLDVLDEIVVLLVRYYKENEMFGRLRMAIYESELTDQDFAYVVDRLYANVEPEFLSRYMNTAFDNLDSLADDILEKYDGFDMSYLIKSLGKIGDPHFDVKELTYHLYQREGEEMAVRDLLLDVNKRQLSAEEIIEEINDLGIKYPDFCILRTIKILVDQGLVLPFDALFRKFAHLPVKQNVATGVEAPEEQLGSEENIHEDPGTALALVDRNIMSLADIEESQIPNASVIDFDDEDELEMKPDIRTRWKIIERKKEIDKIERRKTVAAFLVGAGAVLTTCLIAVYKINPLVAAKNCWTSISAFAMGDLGLSQLMPSVTEGVAILAGLASAFIGTISMLKNSKKGRKAEEDLEALENLVPEEEVEEFSTDEDENVRRR